MAATGQVQRPKAAANPWDTYAGVLPRLNDLVAQGQMKAGSPEYAFVSKRYTPENIKGIYSYAKTPAEQKLLSQWYENFGTLGGQFIPKPVDALREYQRQLGVMEQGTPIAGYTGAEIEKGLQKYTPTDPAKLEKWKSGNWTDADLGGMFKYAQTGFKAPKQGPGFGFNLAKNLIMGTVLAPIGGAVGGMLGGGTLGAMGGTAANQAAMGLATTGKPNVNVKDVLAAGVGSALAPKAPTAQTGGNNMATSGGMSGGFGNIGGKLGTTLGAPAAVMQPSKASWANYLAPAVGGYITGGTKGAGTNILQALLGQYGPKVFGQSDVGEALLGGAQAWLGQEAQSGNANKQNFLTGTLGNVAGQGSSPWNAAAGQAAQTLAAQNQQNQLIQAILPQIMSMMGNQNASQPTAAPLAPPTTTGGGGAGGSMNLENMLALVGKMPGVNYTPSPISGGIGQGGYLDTLNALTRARDYDFGKASTEARNTMNRDMMRRGIQGSGLDTTNRLNLEGELERARAAAMNADMLNVAGMAQNQGQFTDTLANQQSQFGAGLQDTAQGRNMNYLLNAAQMSQQGDQFSRNLGQQESQFGRNLSYQNALRQDAVSQANQQARGNAWGSGLGLLAQLFAPQAQAQQMPAVQDPAANLRAQYQVMQEFGLLPGMGGGGTTAPTGYDPNQNMTPYTPPPVTVQPRAPGMTQGTGQLGNWDNTLSSGVIDYNQGRQYMSPQPTNYSSPYDQLMGYTPFQWGQ